MTILDQIDRVTSGLCPCGAPPAAGSAYCSDDCRPTHISDDTDTRASGDLVTAMRWRPDLVTGADDSDLIPLGSETHGYTGRFNAQVYERLSNPTVWHLRLDDGHRYVGCDLTDVGSRQDPISVELVGRIQEAWRRLERDLTDPRHAAPIDHDPWPELLENHYAECGRRTAAAIAAFVEAVRPAMRVAAEAASAVAEGLAAAGLVAPVGTDPAEPHAWTDLGHITDDGLREPVDGIGWGGSGWTTDRGQRTGSGWTVESGTSADFRLDNTYAGFIPAVNARDAEVLRDAGMRERRDFLVYSELASAPESATVAARQDDPMGWALAARRNRNTGPTPDRLDGRRRRR